MKNRGLTPAQMTRLLEGLAAIGYTPGEQVCGVLQVSSLRGMEGEPPML